MSLLEVEELRTGYGALPVLQGISFAVEEGETAVMFGLNGAGKTTTVNALAGLLPIWSGDVRLDGKSLKGLDAPQIVAAGIGLSPEGRRVFPQLSVLTNLRLGAWTRKRGGKKAIDDTIARVFEYFPRLEERKDQLAGTMSGGEQQMLAIGRALMNRPTLLTESRLGGMAWYQIFIANLLAAAGMFWFMWRRHPGLRGDLDRALTGTDDHHVPPGRASR